MGNVNQEAILFNDTIFNNIAFGVENATIEDVRKAARVANADEFIMATENGYDTVIGDRGCRLSGGQRQRISIARAVLKILPYLYSMRLPLPSTVRAKHSYNRRSNVL